MFEELTNSSVHWKIHTDLRPILLGADGLRLQEWLAAGFARVVKRAAPRTVYHICLPELRFFLKHNHSADTRARFREWLRPGKAFAEFDRMIAVTDRGIPTAEPLAAGVVLSGPNAGESYLITRELENVRQLNTFLEQELPTWPAAQQGLLRRRIAESLGVFLARMHDAGIIHHDLHPGNLLLALDDEQGPALYLIDLHMVRLGAPLTWPAARDNLVMLNRWFGLRSSRADRLRFWHAYAAASRLPIGDGARDVEKRTRDSNLRLWRSLDRRCVETNRRYRRFREAGFVGHAVADLTPETVSALLRDADAPFTQANARLLKNGGSSTVVEMDLLIGGVVRPVIYKRFNVTSWRDTWAALVRPTGAQRSWINGHALRLRWLPTPRPLAVFHRKRLGLSREAYLLAAKIPDAEDLHAFLERIHSWNASSRYAALRLVLEQAARLVRDMHERQISHRDLKAANVLVVREDSTAPRDGLGEPQDHWPLTDARVWLIDLVGVRRHRRLGRARKIQNLARLNASFLHQPMISRTDRLRFLIIYLRAGLRGRAGWRDWWKAIARATRAKVAKNVRTGRPLA